MDRHIRWHQQLVERFGIGQGRAADEHFRRALLGRAADERGQATVEFAVVLAAGLAIVVALGALANAAEGGMFVEHAVSAASHSLGGILGGAADVFSY